WSTDTMPTIPDVEGLWLAESAPFTAALSANLAASAVRLLDTTRDQTLVLWSDQDWQFFWSGAAVPAAIQTPDQPNADYPAASIPARAFLEVQYTTGMTFLPAGGGGAVTVTGFRA